MAAPSPVPSLLKSIVLLVLALLILYFAGRFVIGLFGAGNEVQRAAAMMHVENRGTVNVSLEGGLMQRAEDSLKLYPGDRVTTGSNGHALLSFFEGTGIRLDEQSDLTIEESSRGTSQSTIELELTKGALWIRTPKANTYSGSVIRTIITPSFSLDLPSDTEAVIEEKALIVFSADGQGVKMTADGADDAVYIGEGQKITLPAEVTGDILSHRTSIDPMTLQRPFVEDTRAMDVSDEPGSPKHSTDADTPEELLVVTNPADKTLVTGSTVKVEGTIGLRVDRVRVNGYQASIDKAQKKFSQELSLREGETETTILVEALDARGLVLAKVSRTVKRGSQKVEGPAIVAPAKGGETYRTQKTEIEINGTAPAAAAGIMVNDYKLQLFRPGDKNWSYLASTTLNNYKQGTNVYDVYVIDANGNRSDPVRLTILLEAGSVGVVGTSSSAAGSASSVVTETQLPNNAPLKPGTIAVTGPTPGATHTATGSEFVLQGSTPSDTQTVWVNGYRLQLYTPGKTTWNYIAKTEYQTLKPGTNVYRIVARNEKGEIIDAFEYTATYKP